MLVAIEHGTDDLVILELRNGGQYGALEGFIAGGAVDGEQGFEHFLLAHLSHHHGDGGALGHGRGLVLQHGERLLGGFSIARSQRKRYVIATLALEVLVKREGQLLGQGRHLAAFEGGGKARHDFATGGFVGRQGKKLGAGLEVGLATCESPPFGDVLDQQFLRYRELPNGFVSEEIQHGISALLGLAFDSPPGHERQADVLVIAVLDELADDGQTGARGQALGAGGNLHLHFGIGFVNRQGGHLGWAGRPLRALFANDLHRPAADIGVRVVKHLGGVGIIHCIKDVQAPEGIERARLVLFGSHRFELGDELFQAAPANFVHGLLTHPFVGVAEVAQQLVGRGGVHVEGLHLRRTTRGADAVNAAVGLGPVIHRTHMAEAGIVPISHVEAAIGTGLNVHRAEPAVRGGEHVLLVLGLESGAGCDALAHPHEVGQRVRSDDPPLIGRAEHAAFINAEGLREAAFVAFALHVLEVAEGIGIGERAVLAPVLHAVHALVKVHAAGAATIGAGEDAALAVDVQAEGIAATLAIDFEDLGLGVIAPHHLAFPFHIFRGGAADVAGGGAAIDAIEPAVRPPLQVVGHGMGVLQAEAGECHLGVAIRNAIIVRVGVEKQVGRVQHPDAAGARDGRRGNV